MHEFIERTLWYETSDGRAELSQSNLLNRTEPLIILGEAGMGKSHLLNWLATFHNYSFCTARQLINRHSPKTLLGDAQVLVIDALDEVTSRKEGDAVDEVLKKLGELDYPRFILSCRVADWRSATGIEAIREQYSGEPLELHLTPFDDNDAISFLNASLGTELAKEVITHFNTRGLNGLLGNPQTLDLISRVASTGNLPKTRNELFAHAIEILRVEHRDDKAYAQLAREVGLNAVGASFASIILTGNEAIVRTAQANTEEGELHITDISGLSGGESLEEMLGTRLFKADRTDRFSYIHRSIGEYLGAHWLAKLANDDRKRRRILSLFHSHRHVPASLRGIHAWLAIDPAFSQAVIAADPMGMIEYGDTDVLTVEQAHLLIESLEKLAVENPQFYNWRTYSLRGIAHPELIEDIHRLITTPETPFSLCLLLLEAIKGTIIAPAIADDLRKIVLDPKAIFASRRAAGEALTELPTENNWPAILQTLQNYGDELSIRLAINLLDDIGYQQIDDHFISNLVVSWAKSGDRTIGMLMGIERRLPTARIEGVLDRYIGVVKALGKPHKRPGDNVLTDFAYQLIVRKVEAGSVTAEKFWSWLEPFHADVGYDRENHQRLNTLIQNNDQLRHATQRLILLESPGNQNLWRRMWRLNKRSTGLAPNATDIIALLKVLDPSNRREERWRELIQLTQHDGEVGAEVRAAAKPFAAHRPDLLKWINRLSIPRLPKWQIQQVKRERRYRAKQAVAHAEARKYFAGKIKQLRAGEYSTIIDPAKAYLKLFSDIGDDAPAHERVSQWLGEDIGEAAHEGFEAFLRHDPPTPSAQDIVEALTQRQYYEAGTIIISALAERLRKNIGFDDLTDERLMAGLFELRRSHLDDHAGIVGLRKAIETTTQARGIWEKAMRLYHEPQLKARRDPVDGLHALMQDDTHVELNTKLAVEWLERYPDLPISSETALIDKLLQAGHFDELRRTAAIREDISDNDRRRNWDAVGLIVDFQNTKKRLEISPLDLDLLWNIQHRTNDRYNRIYIPLFPEQIEWIIKSFRAHWPMVSRPNGISRGDKNPWEASNYILHLIDRLGNDTSEDAVTTLIRLQDATSDGYTESIKVVIAEQARKRMEASYTPPTLEVINAITRDTAPQSAVDLQALVIEELKIVQTKIKSDDAESWRGFYNDDGVPFKEERCRDHLLGLLRQGSKEIMFDPEAHVAADKEVDIACSVGMLRMPIEIKGQWHSELWQGADNQLKTLYTSDWRAEGRGIYLVLWFGQQEKTNKRLKSPGRGKSPPKTANELQEMLIAESKSANEGHVVVFVLDIERLNEC